MLFLFTLLIITKVSQVIIYLCPEGCAACETSSHRTFPCLRGPIPKPLPPGKGLTYDLKVFKYGSFANAKLKIFVFAFEPQFLKVNIVEIESVITHTNINQ